jgi:hypothetical protein
MALLVDRIKSELSDECKSELYKIMFEQYLEKKFNASSIEDPLLLSEYRVAGFWFIRFIHPGHLYEDSDMLLRYKQAKKLFYQMLDKGYNVLLVHYDYDGTITTYDDPYDC